jgi:N-acetylmuramoyl-L-alanine amidase
MMTARACYRVITFVAMAAAIWAVALSRAGAAPSLGETVSIQGRPYWDARDIGRRFGLTPKFDAKSGNLRLVSRWTEIELEPDSQEMRINDLSVFLSDPVAADHGRFFIGRRDVEELIRPILVPHAGARPPAVRTIVIDAGHGGNDHGNENTRLRLREKAFTLDVARRLARLLTQGGFRVIMTRKDDRRVELEDRVALADRVGADLFVSVHFNSFTQPGVSGAETYVLTPRYAPSTPATEHDKSMRVTAFPGNAFDHWNALLGYKVHRAIIEGLGAEDRGFKRYRYYVLRMCPCPAVLVEAAFLSNDTEGRKVNTAAYRARIADAISKGVKAYATTVSRARSEVASRTPAHPARHRHR